jgi:hypothetical protein
VPTLLIRMHGRAVGTPPDAVASGGFAHPTKWFDRTQHSYSTLPARGKSAEIFLLICGGRGILRRHIIAAKKPALAA